MTNKILRYTLAALLSACAVLFLLPLTIGRAACSRGAGASYGARCWRFLPPALCA